VSQERELEIPDISVRIRRRDPYAPLENLTLKELGQVDKRLHMRFESKDGDVVFGFVLDFGAERLEFSLFDDLAMKDVGTTESAERIAELHRFHNEYFGNGALQIIEAETGTLISRKDPFIPLNMYLDHTKAAAEIAGWKVQAAQRRERARKFVEEMERNASG
jgi:hypothetical protein